LSDANLVAANILVPAVGKSACSISTISDGNNLQR
jgi:hypothetical protein